MYVLCSRGQPDPPVCGHSRRNGSPALAMHSVRSIVACHGSRSHRRRTSTRQPRSACRPAAGSSQVLTTAAGVQAPKWSRCQCLSRLSTVAGCLARSRTPSHADTCVRRSGGTSNAGVRSECVRTSSGDRIRRASVDIHRQSGSRGCPDYPKAVGLVITGAFASYSASASAACHRNRQSARTQPRPERRARRGYAG
jgi:hypothetical protein